LELWWQNERGLTDWFSRTQHAQGVPLPSYRYKKGDERIYIKKMNFFNVLEHGLLKPAGNVASRQRIVLYPFAVKHTK
jgi:hypothetical protein